MHQRLKHLDSDLLLLRKLLIFLGQNLGQVQVAHLRVDFGIFGSFLHEEAKVRRQGFLREIWVSLLEQVRGYGSTLLLLLKFNNNREFDTYVCLANHS